MGMLEILLDFGFDANGTSEDKSSHSTISALEIAAMTANEEAFKLLAPHCKEDSKKKLANLVLVGLREKTPSNEFKTLFTSIPSSELGIGKESLEEAVLACTDPDQLPAKGLINSKGSHYKQGQCVQGANLLQIFARKGKAAHIAFLVEQGLDPEATTEDEPLPAIYYAWLHQNVFTLAELMKHTQWHPSNQIRNTEVWSCAIKESERSWQSEITTLVREQNKLLTQLLIKMK